MNTKAIIIGSILLGMFFIGMGNMDQYADNQETLSSIGIISILWSWAYWLTIKQEQPKIVGKKNIEDIEYTSIFKKESNEIK